MVVTQAQVLGLAPNAISPYRDALVSVQAVLDRYSISDSALRVAHFFAQVMQECGGLSIRFESLNYSPQRLPIVWPKRFAPIGPLDPNDYAHNSQKLANEVYGGRMGNTGPNDGFTYRGRGLLQITGKESYARIGKALGLFDANTPDFTLNPDEVISADWCLKVAAAEWDALHCNALADQDSIRKVTLAINGGLTGLADRVEWLKKTKFVWH